MLETGLARVNGVWQAPLALDDRGLMYGDGVFRTLRVVAGQARWLPEQLDKLAADAARIQLPSIPLADWQDDIQALSERLPDATVKLIHTRGSGARGYRPPAQAQPSRIAMASPLADPATAQQNGIVARLCDLRLGTQPALAGIKHLNRLENVLARAEWDDSAIHEGILLDEAGRVVSGVSSNLFIQQGRQLITPRIDRCGVAGVARERLRGVAVRAGFEVCEADFDVATLRAADALLICNSLIRVNWTARLGDRSWPRPDYFDDLMAGMDD